MNWNLIANVSAIVTCVAFTLYIIGHIWAIHISKNKIFEKCEFEDCKEIDLTECFNLAGEYGRVFSISSPEGIRSLKIYEAILSNHNDILFVKGKLIKTFTNMRPNQKQYIRAEFSDLGSNIYLDIERSDYIRTSFVVADSGKDGSFVQVQYKSKMTFVSWLYYLCK